MQEENDIFYNELKVQIKKNHLKKVIRRIEKHFQTYESLSPILCLLECKALTRLLEKTWFKRDSTNRINDLIYLLTRNLKFYYQFVTNHLQKKTILTEFEAEVNVKPFMKIFFDALTVVLFTFNHQLKNQNMLHQTKLSFSHLQLKLLHAKIQNMSNEYRFSEKIIDHLLEEILQKNYSLSREKLPIRYHRFFVFCLIISNRNKMHLGFYNQAAIGVKLLNFTLQSIPKLKKILWNQLQIQENFLHYIFEKKQLKDLISVFFEKHIQIIQEQNLRILQVPPILEYFNQKALKKINRKENKQCVKEQKNKDMTSKNEFKKNSFEEYDLNYTVDLYNKNYEQNKNKIQNNSEKLNNCHLFIDQKNTRRKNYDYKKRLTGRPFRYTVNFQKNVFNNGTATARFNKTTSNSLFIKQASKTVTFNNSILFRGIKNNFSDFKKIDPKAELSIANILNQTLVNRPQLIAQKINITLLSTKKSSQSPKLIISDHDNIGKMFCQKKKKIQELMVSEKWQKKKLTNGKQLLKRKKKILSPFINQQFQMQFPNLAEQLTIARFAAKKQTKYVEETFEKTSICQEFLIIIFANKEQLGLKKIYERHEQMKKKRDLNIEESQKQNKVMIACPFKASNSSYLLGQQSIRWTQQKLKKESKEIFVSRLNNFDK